MINFPLQDIDKGGNHCALVASYRKSCTPSKLIACSCLRLPSPLRHYLEVSSCAFSSLLLGPWRSKLYSTWAGFEFAGTSLSPLHALPPLHCPSPFPLPQYSVFPSSYFHQSQSVGISTYFHPFRYPPRRVGLVVSLWLAGSGSGSGSSFGSGGTTLSYDLS